MCVCVCLMHGMEEKVVTKIDCKCSENVTVFIHFVKPLTAHSCVPGEIRRLNWGMLATIWSRITCLAISCLKHKDWNIRN
jgi:hypothetical protein